MDAAHFPDAIYPYQVGTYAAPAKSGGGLVWDAVLEYRVWCHPERGAPAEAGGSDDSHAFASLQEALDFSDWTTGAEEPLALVLQKEYIEEPKPGEYIHVRRRRITEWPVECLSRPKRTSTTISTFLAHDAPANRLDILRGDAAPPGSAPLR